MGFRLAVAARNAAANAAIDLLDGGPAAGTIKIYTGAQPTNPDTAIGAVTLLATFTLADPAFGASVAGVKTIDASPILTTTGVAAGTAAWFRGADSTGAAVCDGTVSATGGGGNLEINTTSVSIGLDLSITGGTVTMPLGV
jgi:hypothetical protein